jgi:hypothetical protein
MANPAVDFVSMCFPFVEIGEIAVPGGYRLTDRR